ncbi:MAG TPA: isochorismatase family cysteine hydrolase [Candidatus Binatia bacterium]|nr:isochorismatase family cysteine hydrolase [Candidatus Binatia bacterium]
MVSPVNNQDLHGNVPDDSSVVLILIDLINDFEFDGADPMFKNTLAIAQPIARLKKNAKAAGIPVIYVNDNFGKWQSDFRKLVDHCLEDNVKGKPIAQLLKPDERDYFVLKPKHSAFYSTSLDLLLRYLKADTVILTGIAGNICVLFTASDAYMRDFHLLVPRDCIASETEADNQYALTYMSKVLKADTRPSTDIDFKAMSRQKHDESSDKAVRWK